MEDVTRRQFLKAAGLAVASMAAVGPALAQEKPKTSEEAPPPAKDEKKAEPAKPTEEKKEKSAPSKPDDEAWEEAWKETSTEETRTCPQCGATMYRQGRTWTCENCGYSYVE